jgi:hypothetical protein
MRQASIHAGFRVPTQAGGCGNKWEQPGAGDLLHVELLASYAHEIAHSAAALYFGCEVLVEISFDRHPSFRRRLPCPAPGRELPSAAWRAIGLAGSWARPPIGWREDPRLTPGRLAESVQAGRVAVSPGDLVRAAGWQGEDMARPFGIVREAWPWIVGEAKSRALVDHPWLVVPTVPTHKKCVGTAESLAAQGMPHVPTVPTDKQGEVK